METARTVLLAALVAGAWGCDKASPPAPTPAPNGVETIRGTERLGWDQRAADTVELATFSFAIYVDGARSEVADASCGTTAGANGFPCSGRLPAMAPGQHALELASFIVDAGTTLESPRSAALQVNVASSVAGVRTDSLRPGRAGTTGDGIPLRLEVVADGLDEPSDIAFGPDGRLFVAERDGILRIVDLRRGTESVSAIDRQASSRDPRANTQIVALALDRDFEITRHVFVVVTSRASHDGAGERDVFSIMRYRELNGQLGERMVLLDGVPARHDRAAAALGVGPDSKLYIALDDGGDARSGDDPASLNARILRLNRDGTTPDDRPHGAPAQSTGYRSPRGLDWGPDGALWVADGAPQSPERLIAWTGGTSPGGPTESGNTGVSGRPHRPGSSVTYALAPNTDPSDAAFYCGDLFETFRGNLLVAAEGGGHLLRVQLDARSPTRVTATERLLDGAGSIRAVAVGPDGAIYVATPVAIGRLSPATTDR